MRKELEAVINKFETQPIFGHTEYFYLINKPVKVIWREISKDYLVQPTNLKDNEQGELNKTFKTAIEVKAYLDTIPKI